MPNLAAKRNYEIAKRAIDIAVAFLGIFLLSPFMLIIAFLICIDSPGSPIFRQVRVGRNGREFIFFKFRTMIEDAEKQKHLYANLNEAGRPLFKITNDPRLTKVGRFLRRTNLDEIPQLFNVLKGQMSLVGPRPNLPEEVTQYEPWQIKRLEVKPGMASLWHIGGYKINAKFEEWVKSDIYYIENMGFSLDLKIILVTLKMIGERSIYG